jgi:hypothetical protein
MRGMKSFVTVYIETMQLKEDPRDTVRENVSLAPTLTISSSSAIMAKV